LAESCILGSYLIGLSSCRFCKKEIGITKQSFHHPPSCNNPITCRAVSLSITRAGTSPAIGTDRARNTFMICPFFPDASKSCPRVCFHAVLNQLWQEYEKREDQD
jgi:hypothetical protein